jgi:hypothetical protein
MLFTVDVGLQFWSASRAKKYAVSDCTGPSACPVQSQRSIFVQGSDLCDHEQGRVTSSCDLGMRLLNGSHFVLRLVCCATTGEPQVAWWRCVQSCTVRHRLSSRRLRVLSTPEARCSSDFDLCESAGSRRRCTVDKIGCWPRTSRSHAPAHVLLAGKQCTSCIVQNFGPSPALIAGRCCPPDCRARVRSHRSLVPRNHRLNPHSNTKSRYAAFN